MNNFEIADTAKDILFSSKWKKNPQDPSLTEQQLQTFLFRANTLFARRDLFYKDSESAREINTLFTNLENLFKRLRDSIAGWTASEDSNSQQIMGNVIQEFNAYVRSNLDITGAPSITKFYMYSQFLSLEMVKVDADISSIKGKIEKEFCNLQEKAKTIDADVKASIQSAYIMHGAAEFHKWYYWCWTLVPIFAILIGFSGLGFLVYFMYFAPFKPPTPTNSIELIYGLAGKAALLVILLHIIYVGFRHFNALIHRLTSNKHRDKIIKCITAMMQNESWKEFRADLVKVSIDKVVSFDSGLLGDKKVEETHISQVLPVSKVGS